MGRGESNPSANDQYPACLSTPSDRLLTLQGCGARGVEPRRLSYAFMLSRSLYQLSGRALPVFPGCHPRPCYPLIFPFTLTFPKSSCPDIPLIVMPPPLIVQSQSYGQLPTYPLIRSFTCVNVQFQNSQRHTLPSVAVNITAHTSFLLIVVSIISHILFVNTPL